MDDTIQIAPEEVEILEGNFSGFRPGNRERTPICETIGPISDEEALARLNDGAGTKPKLLKNLRASHHRAAMMVAEGESDVQISLQTGYTPSRVSILRRDPAFKELVAAYMERAEDAFVDRAEKMSTLSSDALSELQRRMEEEPEKLTTKAVLDIAQLTLDRTGHGPQSKSVSITANISGEKMEEMRNRAREQKERGVKIASGHPPAQSSQERSPEDQGAESSLGAQGTDMAGTQEAQGREGEGQNLREEGDSDSEEDGSSGRIAGRIAGGEVV